MSVVREYLILNTIVTNGDHYTEIYDINNDYKEIMYSMNEKKLGDFLYQGQTDITYDFSTYYDINNSPYPFFAFKTNYIGYNRQPIHLLYLKDPPISIFSYTADLCRDCTDFRIRSFKDKTDNLYAFGINKLTGTVGIYTREDRVNASTITIFKD